MYVTSLVVLVVAMVSVMANAPVLIALANTSQNLHLTGLGPVIFVVISKLLMASTLQT
jgi:hypothetical protein